MKKLTIILSLVILASLFASTVAGADLGVAAEVIASDVTVIRTALLGEKIVFSDTDVKTALALLNFDTITIKSLPSEQDGRLLYAGRAAEVGQRIKRKGIPSLVFIPSSKEVTEASFTFTVDGYGAGCEIKCLMRFIDKVNYAPMTDNEGEEAILTWEDISHHGRLNGYDPEGDGIEYMVIEYPKYGSITVSEEGDYVYKPATGYTGKDSFRYVLRDEYGNYSTPATVRITVDERLTDITYTDMMQRREHGAALAMTGLGIMGGRTIGDGIYFEPDEEVTRAEFIALAMKALGIKQDTTATATYFDDDEAIPDALRGYIATAQRIGIAKGSFVNGELLFNPNEPMTKYDAAVVMASLKGADTETEEGVFAELNEIPVYARGSVLSMYDIGVFDHYDEGTQACAITRAEAARYLYNLLVS